MGRAQYLGVVATASFAAALLLIFGVGYYENPALLLLQLALTGFPIFVPLALLAIIDRPRLWGVLLVGVILAAGWGYMAYVDSRPYQGGGASFAIFLGWAASAVAIVAALLAVTLSARK